MATVNPWVHGHIQFPAADIDDPRPPIAVCHSLEVVAHNWPEHQLAIAHDNKVAYRVLLGLISGTLPVVPEDLSSICPEPFARKRLGKAISSSRRRIAGRIRCIGTPACRNEAST
jgi:hypothetical protein